MPYSAIHPYPAMVPESIAKELAQKLVRQGMRVIDPFAGSGRILMSCSQYGATCVGVDVNPLAILIMEAKQVSISDKRIKALQESFIVNIQEHCQFDNEGFPFDFSEGRKVQWFSLNSTLELCAIINWINSVSRNHGEAVLLSVILSSTVRTCSFATTRHWKLHRTKNSIAKGLLASPIKTFKSKLCRLVSKQRTDCEAVTPILGDSRDLCSLLRANMVADGFDLSITSPPYGDSKTTVQYGGVSSLCLAVIQYVKKLGIQYCSQADIDGSCLGGRTDFACGRIDGRYWNGGLRNPRLADAWTFLEDTRKVAENLAKLVDPGGTMVFLVGRRLLGGWRLYLDLYIEDVLRYYGWHVYEKQTRKIERKSISMVVNSRGGNACKSRRTLTMTKEFILFFRKK